MRGSRLDSPVLRGSLWWWRDVGGPWEVPGMKAWINRPWDVWDVSFILFAPTTYRPQYLNLVHSLPSWEVLDQLRSKPTELAGLVNCREPMTMTLSETSEAADLHVQLLPQSHQSPIFPFQDLHISSTFRPFPDFHSISSHEVPLGRSLPWHPTCPAGFDIVIYCMFPICSHVFVPVAEIEMNSLWTEATVHALATKFLSQPVHAGVHSLPEDAGVGLVTWYLDQKMLRSALVQWKKVLWPTRQSDKSWRPRWKRRSKNGQCLCHSPDLAGHPERKGQP